MYDNLIGNLRAKATHFHFNDETSLLLCKAVDAIEELQKQLREEKVDNVNLTGWLAEEHAKHLWIPVTERLPKENSFYLCLYKHKHPGGVAMDEGLSILQWYNGRWNLNEIYTVTHWMPLPEPPTIIEAEGENNGRKKMPSRL